MTTEEILDIIEEQSQIIESLNQTVTKLLKDNLEKENYIKSIKNYK